MPKLLPLVPFDDPVLSAPATYLTDKAILSDDTQALIADMRHTLEEESYGVGLAAPQVGEAVALSVIGIKPTPNRPGLQPLDMVIINPVLRGYGKQELVWEGCLSNGKGDEVLFAQVPRFEAISLVWQNEHAKYRRKKFSGFLAQVLQHETDHLNGVLFTSRVPAGKTYLTAEEYRRTVLGIV